MKARLVMALLAISLLPACIVKGRLYPVQGPLSAQTPVPVLSAKASGIFNSGNMSVVLSDGEVCKGRWEVGQAIPAPKGTITGNPSSGDDMPSVWDAVYGQGFYVSHVLGNKRFARAVVTGNRGTILNVEMYRADEGRPNSTPDIKGVAKDNKDNIYKVVF